MEPIRRMTDAQFATIRANSLALVSTLFDGSLLVRDLDGALWHLAAEGDLVPHVARERIRVDAATSPPED